MVVWCLRGGVEWWCGSVVWCLRGGVKKDCENGEKVVTIRDGFQKLRRPITIKIY